MEDTYRTIGEGGLAELVIRGSRFLAAAQRVATVNDVREALRQARLRERHATHHTYAYRLRSGACQSHNDGEPVAGHGILRRIEAEDLADALVIVSRYFGGTKLGVGGLGRAYAEAAGRALRAATIEERVVRRRVRLVVAYADHTAVMRAMRRYDAHVVATTYAESVELLVAVRPSHMEPFRRDVRDAQRGRGAIENADT